MHFCLISIIIHIMIILKHVSLPSPKVEQSEMIFIKVLSFDRHQNRQPVVSDFRANDPCTGRPTAMTIRST